MNLESCEFMKKIRLLVVVFILAVLFGTTNVYAKNPYKQKFNFNGNMLTNCTWYAWQQALDKTGVSLPGWGNAATWYESAKKAGFEVGSAPRAKSIVVWSWYNNGKNLGHVGYVERVSGNKIYVWDSDSTCYDQNYAPFKECLANSVSEDTERECYKNAKIIACEESASYWNSPGDLIGYIYLDKVPTTPTTKKVTTTKKVSATTTTLPTKSNNAYLKDIILSVGNITFKKDIFEYSFDVDNKVAHLTIEALAEDDLATVEYPQDPDLKEGENKLEIKVTAEDNSSLVYTVTVNRLAKAIMENTVENKSEKQTKDNLLLICVVSAIVLVSLIIILIVIKLKNIKNL